MMEQLALFKAIWPYIKLNLALMH